MTYRGKSYQAWLLASASALAVVSTQAAAADEASFAIAPQPLASALNEFSVQSRQSVLFTTELAQAKTSPGVSGEVDTAAALARLLEGTGLTWRRQGDTFLIVQGGSGDPQSAGAGGDVDALIVTAQKREENIQDVPIAISAFSQEDLTRSQIAGGPDLMTQVPNMTFTKTNFSSYSIQIRGIGTQAISATTDPAVAVAFNNTPFVRNRFFEQEFYDLQRVEVLRGPQGTLYGRNATAGVVNILSAKPKFGFESRLSADVANYNSSRIEGMINMPLVDDLVAMRLAAAWTKRQGYVTNEITGNPIDGRDLWSTRLSLRFAPTDAIDVNLIWEHFQENDDRLRSGKQLCHKDIVTEVGDIPVTYTDRFPQTQSTFYQAQLSQGCKPASLYAPESFETPNGYQFGFYQPLAMVGLPIKPTAVDPYVSNVQSRDLRVIESTVDPHYTANSDTIELQASVDLSDVLSISSETAWASDFIFSTQDYNRFNTAPGAWKDADPRPGVLENGVFCDPQIGCSDRLVSVDLSTAKSRHFSQEFRLASDFDGPFNFSIGANFLRYDTEDKYYVFINALSLYSANFYVSGIMTPYVAGVSDNHECMGEGLVLPDPTTVGSGYAGCPFIETNSIDNLQDIGHNYFLSKNPYKLISYATFGEAYYQLADNLKLTAGLRLTVDKKEAPRIPSWIISGSTVGYPVLEVIEQEWREPTGRLTLDWKPVLGFTDETLLYASYAHGYKAGGANPPPASIALNVSTGAGVPSRSDTHPTTFDAEFVEAFEVGAKNTFLDGRMTVNLAGFYYDYKGYQLSQIVDRSAITKNFDADVWGLEIEADWRPFENLRLGLKGGYENTEVADGMMAVDVMDRTAGHLGPDGKPDWMVIKPFPVYPSNCIVPIALATAGGQIDYLEQMGNVAGSGDSSPCEIAYFKGLDPLTSQPYVPNPAGSPYYYNGGHGIYYPNYPGFDPSTAPNNGEGFSKDLSGNELPNAPHFTATITADYTLPLPNEWLMTLHTDLYYQSEAWTRIFNTEGYDKLKAYNNINFAAIFTNEDAGWKIMVYVKNVLDRDSITGAFLNSDDTGLTTNVFLTEPRLYGLRVTKEWSGGPWWTGANPNHPSGEASPFTVEIGGQVQRHEAPYEPLRPSSASALPASLDNIDGVQNTALDWGDGREAKLIYRPDGPWKISLGARYGKTNGGGPSARDEEETDKVCGMAGVVYGPYDFSQYCDPSYLGGRYYHQFTVSKTNWATARSAGNREEFQLVDFMVGREAGLGGLAQSTVSLGVSYARFKSRSRVETDAVPDWYLPEGWWYGAYNLDAPFITHSRDQGDLVANREFEGAGAKVSWEAAARLFGGPDSGEVRLDWAVTGGTLFGKRVTDVSGVERTSTYQTHREHGENVAETPLAVVETPVDIHRSSSATVPLVDVSLGLSYEVQRMKVSAGYRWERYFDVLDVGDTQQQEADRTIDGPYFKIAVGFGG